MGISWSAEIISYVVGGPEETWYFTDIINSLQVKSNFSFSLSLSHFFVIAGEFENRREMAGGKVTNFLLNFFFFSFSSLELSLYFFFTLLEFCFSGNFYFCCLRSNPEYKNEDCTKIFARLVQNNQN